MAEQEASHISYLDRHPQLLAAAFFLRADEYYQAPFPECQMSEPIVFTDGDQSFWDTHSIVLRTNTLEIYSREFGTEVTRRAHLISVGTTSWLACYDICKPSLSESDSLECVAR